MTKKCPFRKITYYTTPTLPLLNTPIALKETSRIVGGEEFADCIEKECMAWKTDFRNNPTARGTNTWCHLCGRNTEIWLYVPDCISWIV